MIRRLLILLCLLPGVATAQPLTFPEVAARSFEMVEAGGSYDVAVGPFGASGVPMTTATGTVTTQVWRLASAGVTTFQMLDPLASQLEANGFQTLYTCESQSCGGFDFRFGIKITPAPEMFVDLGDFRYLAARKATAEGPEFVTLLVSRTATQGYVHVVFVGTQAPDLLPIPSSKTPTDEVLASSNDSFATRLEIAGHVVLSDLAFETGSSTLGDQTFTSLSDLAAYLNESPTRLVALVGHTDAVGSLAGNIALSQRRALAVRTRLMDAYGVNGDQVEAEGVGYLAPIASNLTEEGREANRRVEVILRAAE